MSIRKFSIGFTVPPGNNAFVIPWDSTRGPIEITHASIAAGSAYLAPGPRRGRYDGKIIRYSIKCTSQNCTVDEQILTGSAGTSADWESQGTTGTYTLTAGTTATRDFKPLAADHRILVTAGATGPASLVLRATLITSADFGD